jgi:hypothetical protein
MRIFFEQLCGKVEEQAEQVAVRPSLATTKMGACASYKSQMVVVVVIVGLQTRA